MSSDADLFADILEYREVFAALKEFGSGFNVALERRWSTYGDAQFVVTITKRAPESHDEAVAQSSWHGHGTDGNLLTAVRAAVKMAREQEASGEPRDHQS